MNFRRNSEEFPRIGGVNKSFPNIVITIILSLIGLIGIGCYEFYRFSNRSIAKIDSHLLFSAWFSVAYLLTPIGAEIYNLLYSQSAIPAMHSRWLGHDHDWLYFSLILIGYGAFTFGYFICIKRFSYTKLRANHINDSRRVWLSFSVLSIIGILGYAGFLWTYGANALVSNIRYQTGEFEGSRLGSLFLYMRIFLMIAFLLLFADYLKKQSDRHVYNRGNGLKLIVLILSFFVAAYTGIQGASRAYLANIALLPLLVYILVKNKLPNLTALFGLAISVLMILVYGRTVFGVTALVDPLGAARQLAVMANESPWELFYESLIVTFVHPYAGVYTALDAAGSIVPLRLFWDVPLAPAFYLRAFGVTIDYSITYYHTFVLTGEYNSNIPPGIVAFGYYQVGAIGVFVTLFFYGVIGSFIDKWYVLYAAYDARRLALFVVWVSAYGNFVMVGDPREPVIFIGLSFISYIIIRCFDRFVSTSYRDNLK